MRAQQAVEDRLCVGNGSEWVLESAAPHWEMSAGRLAWLVRLQRQTVAVLRLETRQMCSCLPAEGESLNADAYFYSECLK